MSGGQISYEEALTTLSSMFPNIEKNVLEAVLEINNGAMENTVEQLLVMDSDSGGQRSAPVGSTQSHHITAQPSLPAPSIGLGMPVREHVSQPSSTPSMSNAALRARKRNRITLPSNFLVLPSDVVAVASAYGNGWGPESMPGAAALPYPAEYPLPGGGARHDRAQGLGTLPASRPHAGGAAAGPLTQLQQDEMMAQMLQNEMFMDQLAADPEFVAYLRANPAVAAALGIPVPPSGLHLPPGGATRPAHAQGGPMVGPMGVRGAQPQGQAAMAPPAHAHASRITGFGNTPAGAPPPSTASGGGEFMSAIGAMGSDMRRRFDTMAARFRRQTGGGVPWSTSSAGGAGAATASSSVGFGSRFSAMFDGRGQYSSVGPMADGNGRDLREDVDEDGAEMVPTLDKRRSPGTASPGILDGRPSSRADRVMRMGGSPAPASFGRSPALLPARSAGAAGMEEVEIDFSLDGPGPAPAGSSISTGKGLSSGLGGNAASVRQRSPGQATNPLAAGAALFSISNDSDEESDRAALSPKARHV